MPQDTVTDPLREAKSLFRYKLYTEVIHETEKVVRREPTNIDAWVLQWLSLCELEREDDALSLCDQLSAGQSPAVSALVRARILFHLHEYQSAFASVETYCSAHPHDQKGLNLKALILHQLCDMVGAIRCYDQILVLDPADAWALRDKADAHFLLGDYAQSADCYTQLLQLNPKAPWVILGSQWDAHLCHWNLQKALECYDSALLDCPPDSLWWSAVRQCSRVVALLGLWRTTEAMQTLSDLRQCSSIPIEELLADAYQRVKMYPQAETCLMLLLSRDPSAVSVWCDVWRLSAVMGDYTRAGNCYTQALTLDPSCEEALSWFELRGKRPL